jgi:hypothetical protein
MVHKFLSCPLGAGSVNFSADKLESSVSNCLFP